MTSSQQMPHRRGPPTRRRSAAVGREVAAVDAAVLDWPSRRAVRPRGMMPDTGRAARWPTWRGRPGRPEPSCPNRPPLSAMVGRINRHIKRLAERAGFDFTVHVHMLRHACGYALANAGHDTRAIQDWLGYRSIQHTVRYTELASTRFKDFWR